MEHTSQLSSRIAQHFHDCAETTFNSAEFLTRAVANATDTIVQSLLSNGKVLACGNGASAASAQHLVAGLVGHFERERPELAAIALTTDNSLLTATANDHTFEDVFARQIRALGQPGDVLVCITSSGNSANIVAAIKSAQQRDMHVIALTGKNGGRVTDLLREQDVHICVPHDRTMRILEVHILAIHCICDGIDYMLMGEETL